MLSLQDISIIIQIAALIIQTLAILVAGWWGYNNFIMNRAKKPRADISHNITYIPLNQDRSLLRATIIIVNRGQILFSVNYCRTWIQQVSPTPSWVNNTIIDNHNTRIRRSEIDWPKIGDRTAINNPMPNDVNFINLTITSIEPGETDECHFDFIVDRNINTFIIYSHIKTEGGFVKWVFRKREETGWNKTSIYQVHDHIDNHTNNLTDRKGGHNNG